MGKANGCKPCPRHPARDSSVLTQLLPSLLLQHPSPFRSCPSRDPLWSCCEGDRRQQGRGEDAAGTWRGRRGDVARTQRGRMRLRQRDFPWAVVWKVRPAPCSWLSTALGATHKPHHLPKRCRNVSHSRVFSRSCSGDRPRWDDNLPFQPLLNVPS